MGVVAGGVVVRAGVGARFRLGGERVVGSLVGVVDWARRAAVVWACSLVVV